MAQSSAQQMRAWRGPALFSYGFRPFFLFGALWACAAMLIWVFTLAGYIEIASRFDPISWHAHEVLFGYLGAVLAGFLLTAVPNWTGRLPMVGWRLAVLFGLWAAGRVAVLMSALLPAWIGAAVDLAFPVVLGACVLREIIAGKNWRNLVVLALLTVFTAANALFHLEACSGAFAAQGYGLRLGLATAIMMISVIGGRIIPSFTRNWLAQRETDARPAPPMQRFDKLTLLTSLPILALWVATPMHQATGAALLIFAVLHSIRLVRWQGHHTISAPLVWVLHVAYGLIPLGGATLGADILMGTSSQAAAQHIWMAGAIGAMTLAVMTRATRGHTGRDLVADKWTVAIYLCLFGSVIARLMGGQFPPLLSAAGLLWMAAFGGFALIYGPMLARAKPVVKSSGSA